MRRDDAWLLDMLLAARDAVEFTRGVTFERFESDRLLQNATLHVLTIIGEAANHLSEQMQGSLADVPWRQIVAFRNRLVHGYFDVDLEEDWSIIQRDLHPLIRRIEPLVPPEGDSGGR